MSAVQRLQVTISHVFTCTYLHILLSFIIYQIESNRTVMPTRDLQTVTEGWRQNGRWRRSRMRIMSAMLAMMLLVSIPCLVSGEEQITDQSGRVVEIRQRYGNTTYAYNGNRSLIYTATRIQGGGGPDQHIQFCQA